VFALATLKNMTVAAHILGYVFPRLRFCINFDTKWVGQHFGGFFTNSSGVDVMITIFGDFRRKKWRFSLKPTNLAKLISVLSQKWYANFFADFFGENILKFITSVPGCVSRWRDQFTLTSFLQVCLFFSL
jgi:hypothetical protein